MKKQVEVEIKVKSLAFPDPRLHLTLFFLARRTTWQFI
ncbi:hypothetical protein NITMOv2_3568 [Nitrospira moscoviensis]|uniref:Uncharacterized protein n=1 Tax=Nitrospira moscoviensis TaxID=42253 RepID=A0A0K2GG83_NITMO|nr:hypothetical protein NITMOv2_3568 [Nitrospira moscoviensis]